MDEDDVFPFDSLVDDTILAVTQLEETRKVPFEHF
jgi:hypothetical protein